mmetsp:Transcript_10466/g.27422  ORF Transcript_10466/g.27422 Transcript_10466/m.27422 type:complete len:145 (+) Transcript_10466:271-705(+)
MGFRLYVLFALAVSFACIVFPSTCLECRSGVLGEDEDPSTLPLKVCAPLEACAKVIHFNEGRVVNNVTRSCSMDCSWKLPDVPLPFAYTAEVEFFDWDWSGSLTLCCAGSHFGQGCNSAEVVGGRWLCALATMSALLSSLLLLV